MKFFADKKPDVCLTCGKLHDTSKMFLDISATLKDLGYHIRRVDELVTEGGRTFFKPIFDNSMEAKKFRLVQILNFCVILYYFKKCKFLFFHR